MIGKERDLKGNIKMQGNARTRAESQLRIKMGPT